MSLFMRLMTVVCLALPTLALAAEQPCDFGDYDFALDLEKALAKINPQPCPAGESSSLVADVDDRVLFLCENELPVRAYRFALGSGGFPKHVAGDRKTPLGIYRLGEPRPSGDGFGTFIPVMYPTPAQEAEGFTGGDVGLHGPPRENRCDGMMNVAMNWTWGCLAFSSDPTIEAIAAFVSKHPKALLHIERAKMATPSHGYSYPPNLYH